MCVQEEERLKHEKPLNVHMATHDKGNAKRGNHALKTQEGYKLSIKKKMTRRMLVSSARKSGHAPSNTWWIDSGSTIHFLTQGNRAMNNDILLIASLGLIGSCSAAAVEYDSSAVIINGERKIILSGSIHYPRSIIYIGKENAAENLENHHIVLKHGGWMWSDLIQKAKEGGLDTIETYIFWNAHEPRRREYNFTGNLDFVKFFQKVQEAGLHGILRIGPYACAEWNYGYQVLFFLLKLSIVELTQQDLPNCLSDVGFLCGYTIFQISNSGQTMRFSRFELNEMQTFTTKIVNMAKEAKLFASQGGPIILAQIENEYGNVMGPYGEAGKSYVKWCAQMAVAQNTGCCIMSRCSSTVINTCNGFYCDAFTPNNPKNPKIWTENWTGWFKKWGQKDPHRTAEDLAFSVARFFQHNGVNQLGRTSGGPFITTSYDYDAPLDEYGNLNQPKWGHLKKLHAALKLGEKILTNSTVKTANYSDGWVELTTFTSNINGRDCSRTMDDVNVDLQQDGNYSVPAWSVSILQDCNQEIYNTAKVNVQTSLIVKKLQENDTPQKLSWEWAPEPTKAALLGRGGFKATQLLEQKAATNDQSDYLWYMTRVVNKWDIKMTLRVKYSGHSFMLLLMEGDSATVGLQNYGEFFDEGTEGIAGGPVELIDSGNTTDYHQRGRRFYNPHSGHAKWVSGNLPVGSAMTWYKTTFQAPSGTEPVVVDLQGMGKGHAWVNGNSLGRFWPTLTADPNGCDGKCDYRGQYKENKCLYHVPRSFLNNGPNTLILFEEIGGNPSNVSFQLQRLKQYAENAYEGTTLELSCNGGRRTISDIQFASFGDPQGSTCGSFQRGSVEASVPRKGELFRSIVSTFGVGDSFGVDTNRLAVQAVCK
uniref:Beta-galactosidase n=1 Tax=Salix viminalis TaxID=40686 RepID=A0A6N2MX78_SALVM